MAARRLTRKEIVQEDQIHTTINDFLYFLIEKRFLLLTGLAGVAVLVAALYLWTGHREGLSAELQQEFSRAQGMFQAAIGDAQPVDPAIPADTRLRYTTEQEKYTAAMTAFSELSKKASGTSMGEYARYYEALCLRHLGRDEDYTRAMEALAASKGVPELAGLANYSLGEHFLARGDAARAQGYFDSLLKDEKTNLPKDTILLQLAEHYEEAQDKASARAMLERLISEHPNSRLRKQAEDKLAGQDPGENR